MALIVSMVQISIHAKKTKVNHCIMVNVIHKIYKILCDSRGS
jgi:hypothetical protein